MYNIFNMGIGMVIAVDKDIAAELMDHLKQCGETAYEIGVVTAEEGISIGGRR
jgi:phosphoribosylformylglycinamidine cyclo-ligase